jgi:hypothetical protein
VEISGRAIQLRRPLWTTHKLSAHWNQSWSVGDLAPERALVEFPSEDGLARTLQIRQGEFGRQQMQR